MNPALSKSPWLATSTSEGAWRNVRPNIVLIRIVAVSLQPSAVSKDGERRHTERLLPYTKSHITSPFSKRCESIGKNLLNKLTAEG
jgi:hypothetical protein